MDDAHGRTESQRQRPLADGQRVLGVAHSAAYYGIDVHVKVGVLRQELELPVEYFETLFRDFVRIHVIDGNLEPFQARAVQALNTVLGEQIPIRDETGNNAALDHLPNDVVEIRMQQRFSAADRD